MNIKRFVILGLCMAFALSFSSFAVGYDAYYYQNEDGSYGHDTEAYEHDLAVEMVQTAGVDIDPEQYWVDVTDEYGNLAYSYDFEAFEIDYNALVQALSPVEEPPVEEETPDPYPVEWPEEEVTVNVSETVVDETVLEGTESHPVVELGEDTPMVYTLNDLRSGADTGETALADGLKGVIQSIFGVYEPVTTTAVYTETVDGETITTLVDVVADGSAGVDYEYIAGVLLFAVMLFCMMKLLGGVLS